jgi:Leucine-rich repeat (LRR) protein
LQDLSGISGATHLSHLDLCFCEEVRDIDFISKITDLADLNLTGCRKLTDLPPLAGLINLKHLQLNDCASLTNLNGVEIRQLAACRTDSDENHRDWSQPR